VPVVAPAREQLHDRGWLIVDRAMGDDQCRNTIACLELLEIDSAGRRNLLDMAWCVELARTLQSGPSISSILIEDGMAMVAVQCTLFEKSRGKNWLVGMHQDLSIPVAAKVDGGNLRGWSQKEGVWFVQPPVDVLRRMIAIRLHLDPCGLDDGPLKLVPCSHNQGRLDDAAITTLREMHGESTCCLEAGGALIMRPLLLHASSKGSGRSRRRVLHFLFGPPELPCGLAWHKAIPRVAHSCKS
jgi:hypothetical protein